MERDRDSRHHVVIVGAGFGGLQAAKALGKARGVRVTVVDRYNHHVFQPLLYQVATAVLNPADISAPIRSVLQSRNTRVLLAEAQSVDVERKVLRVEGGELAYDSLIIATGAAHSYFQHPEWAQVAPGLKTLEDAVRMRERILTAFEAAERETDPERQREWLTFVIIGGGPTGVELAGALAYMTRHSLPRDFRRIDTRKARVVLVEGMPRVLTAYPETLSEDARRDLERLHVEVHTGAMVTGVDATGVTMGEEHIPTRTVLWGAGVAASPLVRSLGGPLDRAGRVKVTPLLTVPGRDDVYVIGDVAAVQQHGKPVPGIAPAAMQMGRHAARTVRDRLSRRPLRAFRYHDKGNFAVIGRGYAVGVLLDRWRMRGAPAWLVWAGVHIAYLIGFRNRLSVMLNWAYTFLTKGGRDMRLITGRVAPHMPTLPAPVARPELPASQVAPVH
ncbi:MULTISPECIES: NAD(P)/FAD-dependent oxidoreductase [Corallococcus]|uniref:NAD(P)/FAD-dependent oxidoreductase n=1 Tax=Corallococcus TaxID=83461 RepID=UPI00117EA07B|nr:MULTISPECIES: NAD(P)/FAD-dependent oxidoreductase [Corallococcus]NBD10402.1 FAD-dependent oxidoreductase [Corallococcus silvisoli]TSC27824.1 NAD(P)/FAD-dependent oxidoreductase [Corallococcus sp. Z5C101001]